MASPAAPPSGPKVVDLFSGAGGLSLGAARAGFAVCGAIENDKRARDTHALNFPDSLHLQEDIATLNGQRVRRAFGLNGELAGVIGGPPCQGFSYIGRNTSDDPRNMLFSHFFRLVAELQPRFFLAENVPGILHTRNDALRIQAVEQIRESYDAFGPMTIRAHEYGAPTTRARVFFFGCKRSDALKLTVGDFESAAVKSRVTVGRALRGLPIRIDPEWQAEDEGWRLVEAEGSGYYDERLHGHTPAGVGDAIALAKLRKEGRASGCLGTIHTKHVVDRFAAVKRGKRDSVSKAQRLDPESYCPTLRAGTGPEHGSYQAVRPIHPTQDRVITPREAARLQGFPDWFRFAPDKWHSFQQIGNSVSPIVAERLLTVILDALG